VRDERDLLVRLPVGLVVRKTTCWSLTQRQAPCAGLLERTSRARSTRSLLRTGRSKLTTMGMPTPTVSPALGVRSLIAMVCGAGMVVKVLEAVVVLPLGLVAIARTA
jgi:hypothetical protein